MSGRPSEVPAAARERFSKLFRDARHDAGLSYKTLADAVAVIWEGPREAPDGSWFKDLEIRCKSPLANPVRLAAARQVLGITWPQIHRALGDWTELDSLAARLHDDEKHGEAADVLAAINGRIAGQAGVSSSSPHRVTS